jgi:surface protein
MAITPINVNNLHEFGPQPGTCDEGLHDELGAPDEGSNPICTETVAPGVPFSFKITGSSFKLGLEQNLYGSSTPAQYDFIVNWGDGNTDRITAWNQTEIDHAYGVSDTYTISIEGVCQRINLGLNGEAASDRSKVIEVVSWGAISLTDISAMFYQCYNLTTISATDAPEWSALLNKSTFHPQAIFRGCTKLGFGGATVNVGSWNLTGLTSTTTWFEDCDYFDEDLSGMNVSTITSFYGMFHGCERFGQVNGSVAGWDTSSALNMSWMFHFCPLFTGTGLDSFNTSNVTSMEQMFSFCTVFNSPLILGWDTSKVTTMASMFYSADNFNQDISAWDVSSVLDFNGMFSDAWDFDQALNWTFNAVGPIDMQYMFEGSGVFNSDISGWDTSKVTNMSAMFKGQNLFNQNLSAWDVSSVLYFTSMFESCDAFNQPITWTWPSSAWSATSMFRYCNTFNQDISGWNVSKCTSFTNFLASTGLFSTTNYDLLLNAWSLQTVTASVRMDVNASYTIATSQAARDILTGVPNSWTINDSGGV